VSLILRIQKTENFNKRQYILKIGIVLLSLTYVFCMLYLLFFLRISNRAGWMSGEAQKIGYWHTIWNHTNLIPFQTVIEFAWDFRRAHKILSFSFINLAGNVVMFVPLGIFLPYYWDSMRNFRKFVPVVMLMVIVIEVTQVLTLTGTCDIDDFLLNTVGSCIGLLLFRSICLLKERFFHGNRNSED